MEGLWIVIALIAGTSATYLLMRPVLKKTDDALVAANAKLQEVDLDRQKLNIELATVRIAAQQATELSGVLKEHESTISALKQDKSSLSTAIDERQQALANEREQFDERVRDLKHEIEQLKNLGRLDAIRIQDLENSATSMKTTIDEREKSLEEERNQFNKVREDFKAQFAELSANALKNNSEAFLTSAKKVLELQNQTADAGLAKREEEIKQLVKPIQEGLKAVGEATKEMEARREKAFGSLEEQIKNSVQQAAEVARQASGLKDALKKPNVRGRWGEVQLKNCIELAGMEEHCDVEFQASSVSADDERIRPDMIVRMPGGRKIAVDAKTPMDHFLTYIEATIEEERNSALIRHGRAVRNHIASLTRSDYMQKIAESPDFVVMFLPNESFLAMALEKEPGMLEEALNKKVLVTTPGTLIGLLKVIRYGWNEQKIAVNAQKIAEEGEKLNTEIIRFLEDFAKVGLALKAAHEAYDDSTRRVEKQLTNTSKRLTSLGAKSRKALSTKALGMLTAGQTDSLQADEPEGDDEGLVEDKATFN